MSKRNHYQRGYSWGKRTILNEFEQDGEKALYRCDKAATTCRKYAHDTRITKTKNGKPLTPGSREYYRGIFDGMLDGFRKL